MVAARAAAAKVAGKGVAVTVVEVAAVVGYIRH